MNLRRFSLIVSGLSVFAAGAVTLSAQQVDASLLPTLRTVVANERAAAQRREPFAYTSFERSDRTGGRLWTERAVDLEQGRLLRLIAVDGKPVSAEQDAAEKARLNRIAADPSDWLKAEQARRNDAKHLSQLLQLLQDAFVFEPAGRDGDTLKLNYRGSPNYQPKTFEERILWSMRGTVVVDTRALRLRSVEGKLDEDVTYGFGILATIHAGSSFLTERIPLEGGTWKTSVVDTDIRGRALFFKTISRNDHAVHKDFQPLPDATTVQQAVTLLVKN